MTTTQGETMDTDSLNISRGMLREIDRLIGDLCRLPDNVPDEIADRADIVQIFLRELYTGPGFRRVRG